MSGCTVIYAWHKDDGEKGSLSATMVPVLAITAAVLSVIVTALGDIQRPTQGHPLGNFSLGIDIVMPVSITQCELVLIYYNVSGIDPAVVNILVPANDNPRVLDLYLPPGVGYLDWVCDIPTGYGFVAYGYYDSQYYIVQPGSSACLGNVTTTYLYASYYSTEFQSYTQHSPSADHYWSTAKPLATVTFPTSSFSTITANSNLVVAESTTTTTSAIPSSSSLPLSSSASPPSTTVPSLAHPHKSKKAVIAGGVVGGVALILITLIVIFIFLRKPRKLHSDGAQESSTPYPGLMTSQLGPTDFSSPSSNQERHFTNAHPINAVRSGSEFNMSQTAVLGTGSRNYVPASKPVNPERDLALAFDAAQRLTASQRQALVASLNVHGELDPSEEAPPSSSPPPQLSTTAGEAVQEDVPDIATVLGVISRARLSPRERHALHASLHALLRPDQASLMAGSISSSPPSYAG